MTTEWPSSWLSPLSGLPKGVHAVFTSREGGVSAPPFDSFNLGDHVRDDPQAVATNRARLREMLGVRPIFLKQVHGTAVAQLDAHTLDGTEADACVTDQRGLACTIMVADCLPVLFAHASGRVVAAAHAGWRGLASGVLEGCFDAYTQAVQRSGVEQDRGVIAAQTWAWLGPCIGPTAFEVGLEVEAVFVAQQPDAFTCFQPVPGHPDKRLANLSALARQRLQRLGLPPPHGNDGSDPWCTVGQSGRFFSHRRDAAVLGSTGRLAACIWIDGHGA
ncbi:MAG TPA: peptidoglycan editing factor PgeF [Hydrogenophaga sp.]